jgi:hypothetical protein
MIPAAAALAAPAAVPDVSHVPPLARLDRAAVEAIVASGRRLLVQGGMGIHAWPARWALIEGRGWSASAPSRRW